MTCPCPNCGCGSKSFIVAKPSALAEYLMQTNESPSDEQSDLIIAEVAACSSTLGNIEARIVDLQNRLKEPYSSRDSARVTFERYKPISHPLRRIPNEILGEIFVELVNPSITTDYYLQRPGYSDLSLTFLAVCQRWKGVALSVPKLWSIVDIQLAHERPDVGPTSMETVLLTHLQYSKGQPLTISLICPEVLPSSHPIVTFLIHSAPRWQDVFLFVNPTTLLHLNDGTVPFKPALLERLLLKEAFAGPPLPAHSDARSMFNHAPKLRAFAGDMHTMSRFTLPWSQLTDISPTVPIDNGFVLLLPKLTCLERVQLDVSEFAMYVTQPIVLPRLRSLVILAGKKYYTFFSSITCPCLEELEIRHNVIPTQFVDFVRRSKASSLNSESTIHTLTLARMTMQTNEIILLLYPLQSLLTLTFVECIPVEVEFFVELATYRFRFLPLLTQLIVQGEVSRNNALVSRVKRERPSLTIQILSNS